MIMLCRYKPCALWILYFGSLFMVFFTINMFIYFGGFYPSFRLEYCWHWSLLHHTLSLFLSVGTAFIIYRNVLSVVWNRAFLVMQLVLCVSAGTLSGVIWYRVTRNEFNAFLDRNYQQTLRIPPFVEWFQYSQGCCGVNNYKDYVHFTGTVKKLEKYYQGPKVGPPSPNFNIFLPDAPVPANNAKQISGVTFTVPRSCCSMNTRNHSRCGIGIPYTNEEEIRRRLNSVTRGCYNLFYTLLYHYRPTQVTAMYVLFRTYPLFDICFHLLSFYVHAYYYDQNLRAIHAPEDSDEEQEETQVTTRELE